MRTAITNKRLHYMRQYHQKMIISVGIAGYSSNMLLNHHALELPLMFFILLQVFSFKAHISHVNFGSPDHSMAPNCKVPNVSSIKYKWHLCGEIQLITEVLLGCRPNLGKKKKMCSRYAA